MQDTMSVIDEYRGEGPDVDRIIRVRLFGLDSLDNDLSDVLKQGNLAEVGNAIGLGFPLNSYLLFYENPEGNEREGYETRMITRVGVSGGRPYQDLSQAENELKHMSQVYLDFYNETADKMSNFKGNEYSHHPIFVTDKSLSGTVEDVLHELGCELI